MVIMWAIQMPKYKAIDTLEQKQSRENNPNQLLRLEQQEVVTRSKGEGEVWTNHLKGINVCLWMKTRLFDGDHHIVYKTVELQSCKTYLMQNIQYQKPFYFNKNKFKQRQKL